MGGGSLESSSCSFSSVSLGYIDVALLNDVSRTDDEEPGPASILVAAVASDSVGVVCSPTVPPPLVLFFLFLVRQ